VPVNLDDEPVDNDDEAFGGEQAVEVFEGCEGLHSGQIDLCGDSAWLAARAQPVAHASAVKVAFHSVFRGDSPVNGQAAHGTRCRSLAQYERRMFQKIYAGPIYFTFPGKVCMILV
jgi:hypothetical protein